MKEQQTARSYARALMELGKEKSINVADQFTEFNQLINGSNTFENLLFLDVFTLDEKMTVLNELFKGASFDKLVQNFVLYLVREKRTNLIPLIYKEVVVIDDHEKGFLKGTVEGAEDAISPEDLSALKIFLENKLNKKTELMYKKNNKVTAGFRVTVEDLQLDATVDNQFDKLRNSIIGE